MERARNFRNFQISRKEDNLERWTEIFETNFRKMSVPFDFEPEFPEILVEWNAPSTIKRHENRIWTVTNDFSEGNRKDRNPPITTDYSDRRSDELDQLITW